MSNQVIVSEYTADDHDDALCLRNAVFPPIDAEHWAQTTTAAIARLDGELVGVIPFLVREFVLSPGVTARIAIANSVAVAEGMRGQGIGQQMMAAAREFLTEHAEATVVYTGPEVGSPQYRFYRQCGYEDLLYPRMWHRRTGVHSTLPRSFDVQDITRPEDVEEELLGVYRACFATYGGTPLREPGYWGRALNSHIFLEVPYESFAITWVREQDRRTAYALCGRREGCTVVLEWASVSGSAATQLWPCVDGLAADWATNSISVYAQEVTGPWEGSLELAGFRRKPRRDVLVGQVVDADGIYQRWGRDAAAPTLTVWTPRREVTLTGNMSGPDLTLEMTETTFHHLLLGRADLPCLINLQQITVRAGSADAVARVGRLLSPAPWVYHQLDYL
jgi:GNAT superfamily N-acetyltransferase